MIRLPDGRLHLISAITPQSSAATASSASVSQTLPASTSTVRPATPRTLLIGGQRFLLSSMAAGSQVLLTQGSQKIVAGLSGAAALSRPQLLLTSPAASQSTMIRMPSGQHVMLRPSSQSTMTPHASAAAGLSPAGLLSAAGKSPPSTPYAVTPEVVQQGNLMLLSAGIFTCSGNLLFQMYFRFLLENLRV